MNDPSPVFLTVRGTLVPSSLEQARVLHNETAGSAPGIEAARALGDLSHKVYAPCERAGKLSSAKPGELLFHDVWESAAGIQQFFASAHVGEQAARLFKEKDAAVWMRATGAFSFALPAARGRDERYVGMIRGTVSDPEKLIEAFRVAVTKNLRAARKRGQLSHDLYIKLAPPSEPIEFLGVDLWCDLGGLSEHYVSMDAMPAIQGLLKGPPVATVWEQATGSWSEW